VTTTLPPAREDARPLPTMTDPAWANPATVWRIAAVDPGAHDLAHPRPVFGCDACPQSEACPWCLLPPSRCPDRFGHSRAWAGSETTWREVAA
jgi:hypothetical protein